MLRKPSPRGGRKAGPTHRDLARFLIAVPCRRGEAAALDWSHLDLLAAEWSQPGALTKNGEPHRLHLHPLALELLRARHKAVGRPAEGTVFPSVRTGKPFDAWTRMKARLEAETGLKGWRWHDFRRSFATALGEAGTQETVADAVLNHKQAATRAGVLSAYQRSVRWPEQVEAMQAWGAILAAAVVPGGGGQTGAGGNVVALPTPVRHGAKGRKA